MLLIVLERGHNMDSIIFRAYAQLINPPHPRTCEQFPQVHLHYQDIVGNIFNSSFATAFKCLIKNGCVGSCCQKNEGKLEITLMFHIKNKVLKEGRKRECETAVCLKVKPQMIENPR